MSNDTHPVSNPDRRGVFEVAATGPTGQRRNEERDTPYRCAAQSCGDGAGVAEQGASDDRDEADGGEGEVVAVTDPGGVLIDGGEHRGNGDWCSGDRTDRRVDRGDDGGGDDPDDAADDDDRQTGRVIVVAWRNRLNCSKLEKRKVQMTRSPFFEIGWRCTRRN